MRSRCREKKTARVNMSAESTRLRAQLQESQVQTFKLYVEGAPKIEEEKEDFGQNILFSPPQLDS